MDLDYEIWLRLAAFFAVFAVLAIAERVGRGAR